MLQLEYLRGRWINQKLNDRHLPAEILDQFLHDTRAQTRSCAATNCTKDEESPQAVTAIRHAAYGIHCAIEKLTGHQIVATGKVAATIILARYQRVRMKEIAIGSRPYFICGTDSRIVRYISSESTYAPITVGSESIMTRRGCTHGLCPLNSKNVRKESSQGLVMRHPFARMPCSRQ